MKKNINKALAQISISTVIVLSTSSVVLAQQSRKLEEADNSLMKFCKLIWFAGLFGVDFAWHVKYADIVLI